MGTRHQARVCALQMLYGREVGKASLDQPRTRERWDSALPPDDDERCVSGEQQAFTEQLVGGVMEHGPEIDRLIEVLSENWRLSRMTVVDRNILRIATFELMRCRETSSAVIIDEAVELAKQFSDQESSAFVNGILDTAALRVRGEDGGVERGALPASPVGEK